MPPEGGEPAVQRLDRDLFGVAGLDSVIVFEGINDFGAANASPQDVIAGLRTIADRVHEHGLSVIGATLTPALGTPFGLWGTPETDAKRNEVNQFIRTSGVFDGVIDFDAALRDPNDPSRLRPEFQSNSTIGGAGDFLHPNRPGFFAMASAVDLGLLQQQDHRDGAAWFTAA